MKYVAVRAVCTLLTIGSLCLPGLAAQSPSAEQAANGNGKETGVAVPAGYTIGAEDVLSVVFWRDEALSTQVVVRPDGMISVPLLNDVQAAGYTPEELGEVLVKAASKYIEDPTATVIVREINSRKVFIVGQVAKPGAFPLTGDMTVLQLIAQAGDVLEYANAKRISIVRKEENGERRYPFNYRDVLRGRNVDQNIPLQPGDTVIVP
jgi:polysaccharide biosynthesis/export protein